ncbi:hypothetical protein [Bradyrhizobium sp. 172]|uniref:hypothetical protein n=1 Tax=Bradyrhizobium sp. 172 TaxID=2782643 RepID=UPI001FFEE1E5|nr:hypothetical protein [Bradyrhizobium sp. 172]UPJ96402.1 hypothetical protein IVB07_02190 [Bradyrhizobium sp. 172]
MPLIKYFVYVGSALVLFLVGIGLCFPQPGPDTITSDAERPAIRISSAEHPPERVVIDTRLPRIVPLPSEDFAPPPTPVEPAQQRIQDAFAGLKADGPQFKTSKVGVDVAKAKHVTKREPAKKVVAHRAPPLNTAPAPTYSAQKSTPSTRMSLLEALRERLEQTIFKMN